MSDPFEVVKKLGPKKLMVIGAAGASLLVGLIVLALATSGGSLSPLYTNLSLDDTQKIVAEIESQGLQYSIGGNGTQVLVENDAVLKLRLLFAEQGLPANQGASIGYEIFDKEERLGTSNFVQNMNQLRALEGELARTITELRNVRNARVHLVMPKQQLFKKESYNPTASIQLTMNNSTSLNSGEVASIRYLTASSVPGLKAESVTIIDNNGRLLARGGEDGDAGLYASNSNEFKTGYEKKLGNKIEQLLERYVGMGNIQAQVTADIDFDRIETNSEIYDPEGAVVRSVQSTEETERMAGGAGGGEVSVANNLPGGAAGGAAAGGGGDERQRVDEVTNYEITKTIKSHISETGKVNKLSIAVMVDGTYVENVETGEVEYVARNAEELAKLEEVIRMTVGFDEERGDVITVANLQFSPEFSGYKSESMMDWIKEDLQNIIQVMVMGLVAIMVILMVIRPLVRRAIEINMAQQGVLPSDGSEPYGLLAAPAGAGGMMPQIAGPDGKMMDAPAGQGGSLLPGVGGGEEEGFSILDSIQGKQKTSSVKQMNEIIGNSPEEALTTLRAWMYGEAVS